jgi:predicted ATPase
MNVRLVTLSGPAGIGKTRLAMEAARRLSDRYPDGVVYVPLEGLSDTSRVLPAIGAAIGIRDLAGGLSDALIAYLRTRSMLLMLDNFEQVIAAAPVISLLLERLAGLTVLVTSRELLRVQGEHELPVAPLVRDQDAVTLFSERAAAASHGFDVGSGNMAAVVEICRRPGGVPHAIELAAPRMLAAYAKAASRWSEPASGTLRAA